MKEQIEQSVKMEAKLRRQRVRPDRKPRNPRNRIFLALPLALLEAACTESCRTIVAHDATEAAKEHRQLVGTAAGKSVLIEVLAVISSTEEKRLVLKAETWGE